METRLQLSAGASSNHLHSLTVFVLDDQQYALPLVAVERVVRMVEIISLPRQPEIVTGVINIQGRIIPVLNIRQRFHLPSREPGLGDQLIIVRTSHRVLALPVDRVVGVLERPAEETVSMDRILPGVEHIESAIKIEDGLVFVVRDLDRLLSLEEETSLNQMIA